jgi:DNA replication protein DnaC
MYRCRYTTAADMLKTLLSGVPDNRLDQKLKIHTRPDILLIDEVGFDRLAQESADRHEIRRQGSDEKAAAMPCPV